jgi:hypothetical protein
LCASTDEEAGALLPISKKIKNCWSHFNLIVNKNNELMLKKLTFSNVLVERKGKRRRFFISFPIRFGLLVILLPE